MSALRSPVCAMWHILCASLLAALMVANGLDPRAGAKPGKRAIIIGHRGSCGMFPEHTLEGYRQAIEQGADFVECDIVMTKDAVPICRHEPNIAETTDVGSRPEFAARRRNATIDGARVEGFFSVDFTLQEVKQLRGGSCAEAALPGSLLRRAL